MRTQRLSFNLGIVPGVTAMFAGGELPERLARAHAHGFTGVEGPVPQNPAAMLALLQAEGMQYVCMSFARGNPQAGELGITGLAARRQAFRDELERAVEAAARLSCPMIHPLAGLVDDEHRATASHVYAENIALACHVADRAGIRVIVEPICAARQPRFLLNTQAQAHALVRDIGSPNLCVMMDVFHARMSGESPSALAHAHAGSIGLLQVSDFPQRRQPAPDDPEIRATLVALAERQWDGWVSAEYVPQGELPDTLAWTVLLDQTGIRDGT